MTSDRIREIQKTTAYPNSVSVKQALLQVWNECGQENNKYSEEDLLDLLMFIEVPKKKSHVKEIKSVLKSWIATK